MTLKQAWNAMNETWNTRTKAQEKLEQIIVIIAGSVDK